jgi:hypothetical protein
MRTSNTISLLIGGLLFAVSNASAQQPQVPTDEVRTDGVLVCATEADAKNYAMVHKDQIQSSIEGEKDAKSCLVVKVAFVPGKQSDRLEQSDATYAVTEILVVAVKTPYGFVGMRPNLAYTLLRLKEEKA